MEVELKKYYRYKRDLELLLLGPGLWPHCDKYPRSVRIFLNIIAIFSTSFMAYGVFVFCIKNAKNIVIMTRGLSLFISFITAVLKVLILMIHQSDVESLVEGVTTNFERHLKISEYRVHLLNHCSTFSTFFYVLNYSVLISAVMAIITPLSMLKHGKYVRVFPLVLPFSYEPGGVIHWIIFGLEVLAAFYLWTVADDSLFGYFAFNIAAELRLLSDHFEKLSSENYKKDLKYCIDRHIELIETQHTLERVFGFLAMWITITCAICMCALVFQITAMKNFTAFSVCYIIFYVLMKLVQAYTYAWFGNIIAVESQNCLDSMYKASWTNTGDVEFMNDVLIVLSQKPFTFRAKGIMLLKMDLFSKIINTTVSYFFLLQTLEETLDESS